MDHVSDSDGDSRRIVLQRPVVAAVTKVCAFQPIGQLHPKQVEHILSWIGLVWNTVYRLAGVALRLMFAKFCISS